MKISHVIESVDSKVAPVSAPLHAQSTKTQLKQHVYSAPEKKTPAVVNHIKSKDVKEGMAQDEAEETNGWRAELVNQINYNTFEVKMTNTRSKESANFVVRPVDMISIGPTLQIETMDVHDLQTGQTESWTSDDPQPDGGIVYAIAMMFWDNKELQKKLWTIVDTHNTKGQDTMPGLDQRRSIGQEVDADAYIDSQEKTQDVMAKMKQGTLKEFSPIKPPTAGAFGGNKDYGQPTSSRYLGNNKFVLGTTNNYVLTATVDKWGLEWDEDDEIWFLDSPGAVYIADATEGEIELPAPQEQRNQIHDLVSDYLNARNSAELQRVAAYYGHSADGEMATSEGLIAAAIGGGLLWHALKDDDIDDESVYDDEAHEYGIQAYHDGEEQDDNPYSEDFPNTRRAWDYGWAEAHNADISQKTPTTAIPTKINSPADFSKHGFTGYKKPGDMEEGIRVPAQQILGTKNRAKSAYYPTNVKPKVPKLDKPLTDQELARLAQLAGIKSK